MKKNYNYNSLTNKYQLISEAHLNYKKEMFREECWDATSNSPIPECWNEFGEIKQECWSHPSHSLRGGPLKKEMFREECWDATSSSPIPECWNEFGEIKQECWSDQPGAQTMTEPGYAGAAGGDSISEAIKKIEELRKSLRVIQEQYSNQSNEIKSLLRKDQERLTTLEVDLEVVDWLKSQLKN